MMKKFVLPLTLLVSFFVASCADDHDDPEMSPIDTTAVKITANIKSAPANEWLNPTEEMTVTVSDLEMKAPAGVVLRNVNMMVDGRLWQQKPFSGETLVFKLPLNQVPQGRLNLAIWGDLIQKNCRDAQIIIADNIQRIIFSETPEFDCEATVEISVKSKSTTGEEYNHTFEAKSIDHFTIAVPDSELYWTPQSGTASTLELTMKASAKSFATNSTLESAVSRVYWAGQQTASSTLTLTIANTPGSLNSKNMTVNVDTSRFGTWENVTVTESHLHYFFSLRETE